MSTRHLVFVLMLAFVSAYGQTKQPTHRFKCTHNVLWANPDSVPLTMDIYVPDGARANYPVVIIYHGGGWLINQKEIMDSLAVYLVSHANYVVCNVNYRLLGDRGNTITMNQIVEDALGAVVWVKANIAAYKGDGTRIAVTGDSAGGHLAAMVTLCGNKLESDGFAGKTLGFNPTWLPKNITAEDLMTKGGVQVQAAMLSYPAVDIYRNCQNGFETIGNPFWMFANKKPRHLFADTITVGHHADYYKAVSPIYNIPSKTSRQLPPQFCMVGSLDVVTPPSTIKGYVEKCVQAGQPIEFWEYKGRPHAFLDSKKQPLIGVDFTRDGPEAIDKMIGFLNSVFYADAAKKVTIAMTKIAEQISDVALVLEGGGFRGIYTAGVLDVLMTEGLFFDYLIGVSAGAAYGVSYVSRQYKRNLAVNNYVNDPRYCGWGNFFKLGTYFDWEFVYRTMPIDIVPFDYKGFHQSTSRLNVVVTNVETGLAEYKELHTDSPEVFRDWLTATSSLPFIAKPKAIDGKLYMDGGLSDSIPIGKALADGNQRAVVVLTRPKGYCKKPMKNELMMRLFYRKYPRLVDSMKARAHQYNQTLDQLERLEGEGTVFVIRPIDAIPVSRLENNPQNLKTVYDLSVMQMDHYLPLLRKWLARP